MSPRDHTSKVAGKETKKKYERPYRCENCGATFESESERRTHQQSEHSKKPKEQP